MTIGPQVYPVTSAHEAATVYFLELQNEVIRGQEREFFPFFLREGCGMLPSDQSGPVAKAWRLTLQS